MPGTLRRSGRAKKAAGAFSVGDAVEITKGDLKLRGRLVYKLTVGQSQNPRWLVTFDDPQYKDEEVYERAFGKILRSSATEEPEKAPVTSSRKSGRNSNSTNNNTTGNSGGRRASADTSKNSIASSGDEGRKGSEPAAVSTPPSAQRKKTVSFQRGSPDTDDSAERRKVSAREQRSLRRQAKIDETVVPEASLSQGSNSYSTVSGVSTTGKRRNRGPPPNGNRKGGGQLKRPKTGTAKEEVVKVRMKTGTLFLYRGAVRRAEFVRRV